MKLKSLLLASAALGATLSANAQWTIDTIHSGSGYKTNVYYSLANGIAGDADADNWHIGFSAVKMSASILTNSADMACKLWALDVDTTDFGTDLTTAINDAIALDSMSLYNSNYTWENGAFNQNAGSSSIDYGWGEYDANTHLVIGKTIFGLITATDTYQVYIISKDGNSTTTNAPVYAFSIARIDGTNPITHTLELGVNTYEGQNYAYYNVVTDQFLSREPKGEDWDLLFTRYNDASQISNNSWYPVFGILMNNNVEVAQISVDTLPEHDTIYNEELSLTFNDSINAFGYNKWKHADMNGAIAYDTVSWFVKVQNGDIWQVVFTDFVSGSAATNPGMVVLQKQLVYEYQDTTINIQKIETFGNVVIAPNPSNSGSTNILIDATKDINNAMIFVTDINGRIVKSFNKNITKGFHQIRLDVSSFTSGLYFINIQAEGTLQSHKLMIK